MSMYRNLSRGGWVGALLVSLAGCSGGGSGLSGTYEAKSPEGTMSFEFKSGNKVHMVMQPANGPADASDADYLIDGNKVTIQVPGGMPIQLTKNGNTLSANMLGEIMTFQKK